MWRRRDRLGQDPADYAAPHPARAPIREVSRRLWATVAAFDLNGDGDLAVRLGGILFVLGTVIFASLAWRSRGRTRDANAMRTVVLVPVLLAL
jgi:hypothetical protein